MPLGGRGYQVVGLAYLFLVLSTTSIFLRCYVRLRLVKSFGIDDIFALIAWALFMINLAFVVTAAYNGTGQHFRDMPPAEIPVGLKWWWFCEPIFVLASMAIKFSIGICLIRIAQTQIHKVVLWTAIAVMEAFSFFFFFLFIFQCAPSAYFWTQYSGAKGSCINLNTLVNVTYTYSAIACVTDWLYAIMPVFLLWNLKIDIRTKVMVGILIAMGASASIATVIRIPYLKGFRDTEDFLYATTDVALWTTVELGIGIFAASLATLRPLFRKFMSGISTVRSEGAASGISWPESSPQRHGYMRSESRDDLKEYELRNKVGVNTYMKTDIESQVYFERELAQGALKPPTILTASLQHPGGWNSVECHINDKIEEQKRLWREQGIVKTTASRQDPRFSR